MDKMKTGTLFFDKESGRYDIQFGWNSVYGGLHSGTYFDIKVGNAWIPVRIEEDGVWYLAGLTEIELEGLTVRM